MEATGMRTTMPLWASGAVALILGACSPEAASGPPFRAVAPVGDLMHDVVYPHAEVVWDSVGTVVDFGGTHEIRPENEEQWERVAQSALTLAEAGNLLMMGERAKDSGAWIDHSANLTDAAIAVGEAAHNRDAQAVFDTGGGLYEACTGCHEQYWEKPPSAMRP